MSLDPSQLVTFLRSKKALIWDFDGTLVNSEPWHYEAFRLAFAEAHHTLIEADFYERFSHTGRGVDGEIAAHNLTCDSQSIAQRYNVHYDSFVHSRRVQLFAAITSIIAAAERIGLKNAIASNSLEERIRPILDYCGLSDRFARIIARNPTRRKKPAPDLFIDACASLELKPRDVLVLEDSEIGLAAAKAAGCDAVWIKTPCNGTLKTRQPYIATLSHDVFADLLLLVAMP